MSHVATLIDDDIKVAMFSAIKVASFCNSNCWFNFGSPIRISTSVNNVQGRDPRTRDGPSLDQVVRCSHNWSLVQDRPIISSIRRLSKTFGIPSPTKSPGHSMSSKYSSAMSSFRRSARELSQQSCKNQALKSQVMMQHGQVDITYRISNSSKGILVELVTNIICPRYPSPIWNFDPKRCKTSGSITRKTFINNLCNFEHRLYLMLDPIFTYTG